MTKYAPIGTVSHATLRYEDLIPAFADMLAQCMAHYDWKGMPDKDDAFAEYRALIQEARAIDYEDQDACAYVIEDLFDALGDFAPPYTYFGAHEGDGSDFGYWPMVDAESLADASEAGYRVEVTDHGNVSLYDGDGVEIWAVV